MNILIQARYAGPSYVNRGYEGVWRAAGHAVSYWDRDSEGVLDAFRRAKPDLFWGTTWDADESLLKALGRNPRTRCVLYAGTWGDLADALPPDEFPIVRCSDGQKSFLGRLRRETGRPDFVWLHLTPSWVEPVLGGYRSEGITPVGLTNAADLFAYAGGRVRPEYRCDVAFVGGRWAYKARVLDPYLSPLLHPDHPAGLDCKVWGHMGWPHHNYLGRLDEGEARHVFRSATVCPSLGEPHSLHFSDLVERLYKVPAAGGCCVAGPGVGLAEEFGPGVFPAGETPSGFRDLVVHYARHPAEAAEVARRQQGVVLAGHSYHDRASAVFGLLGMGGDAARVAADKAELLRSLAAAGPTR